MEKKNYSGTEYDKAREQVDLKRAEHVSWDDLISMKFLEDQNQTIEDWNRQARSFVPGWINLSKEDWQAICRGKQEEEKRRLDVRQRGEEATIRSSEELNSAVIPQSEGSSWQKYKRRLRENGFSSASVDQIEEQTLNILHQLSSRTDPGKPIKGLVVGNVQSGKTASMAGLMAMAADNGWNFFIVLTGPTTSLRDQTEARLRNDLMDYSGNLSWDYLNYANLGDRRFNYSVVQNPKRILFTVCLKNAARLNQLHKFLEKAPNPEALKILIIDDEGDQASINTGDITKDKRTSINRNIIDLVYGKEKKGKELRPFGALNYVIYTATPYANCLNEGPDKNHGENLYPNHFISMLAPGGGYFGPKTIFEAEEEEDRNRLDVVNLIGRDQEREMRELEKGETRTLPVSLQDSILWFICAAAIYRYRNIIKPVSMLIHTSMRVNDQDEVYEAVESWLNAIQNNAVGRCRTVYEEQKKKLTLKDFKASFPAYESLDEVEDYPDFEELVPFIRTLISHVTTIHLEEEDKYEFSYDKGILLCEDNSSKNKDSDDKHYRLAYPDRAKLKELGFGPAFIVVGGNTLSRGLTLEGLVSSYFLRNSQQGDSLMQMGRWFGYRKGYELLPRIWMTEDSFEKFQFLAELDNDLRSQVSLMSQMGKKPEEFAVAIATSPRLSWLRPTSRNKSQSAETVRVDFAGTEMQLLTYLSDPHIVEKNNRILEEFLKHLGKPEISEADGHSGIWTNVPYTDIARDVFEKGFTVAPTSRTFQDTDELLKWVEEETKKGSFRNWTVVLAGTKPGRENRSSFALNPDFSIGKVQRSWAATAPDRFSMKALSIKRDYVAHLKKKDFPAQSADGLTWENMIRDESISSSYRNYIQKAGKSDVPLMLIYCIDSDSNEKGPAGSPRRTLKDLGIQNGIFGITFVIPGIRGKHGVKMKIKLKQESGDEEDGD